MRSDSIDFGEGIYVYFHLCIQRNVLFSSLRLKFPIRKLKHFVNGGRGKNVFFLFHFLPDSRVGTTQYQQILISYRLFSFNFPNCYFRI
jgi:hypothetical protein